MTHLIEIAFMRRMDDDELPRRYVNPMTEALGLSRRPPPEFRRDSREIEVRDAPDGLTAETVAGFVQLCHDRARSFILQGGIGTEPVYITWSYLSDIARLKFVPIPAVPARPGRGRATA